MDPLVMLSKAALYAICLIILYVNGRELLLRQVSLTHDLVLFPLWLPPAGTSSEALSRSSCSQIN